MPNPLPARLWRLLHHPTAPELALEPLIASLGRVYRFQFPIPHTPWIADFALLSERVLVEVDGKSHQSEAARLKDAQRDAKTESLGWRTVRISNEQALAATADDVRAWLGFPEPP